MQAIRKCELDLEYRLEVLAVLGHHGVRITADSVRDGAKAGILAILGYEHLIERISTGCNTVRFSMK